MYYITKTMEIAGCHKLQLSYESKCEQLHGHNWIVTIYCKAKEQIHGYLDHGNFNELLPFNPTAENIARWICEQIDNCYRVEVQESVGNTAAYEKDC